MNASNIRWHYDVSGIRLASRVSLRTLGHNVTDASAAEVVFEVSNGSASDDDATWFLDRTPPGFVGPFMSTARVGGGYLLRFHSIMDFWVRRDGARIVAYDTGLAFDVIEQLLLDQVLPQALHLRGSCTLHASSVALDGRALAFVGHSGDGKSTIAAALVPPAILLGDDCLALRRADAVIHALPSYASVRLRGDSAAQRGAGQSLDPASSRTTWKRRLPLPLSRSEVPLRRVYLLERGAETRITSCSGTEAFSKLLPHVHRTDPEDRSGLARELEVLADLSSLVSIRRLSYPREYAVLAAVARLVREDAESSE